VMWVRRASSPQRNRAEPQPSQVVPTSLASFSTRVR
jgi:hypothetical protein